MGSVWGVRAWGRGLQPLGPPLTPPRNPLYRAPVSVWDGGGARRGREDGKTRRPQPAPQPGAKLSAFCGGSARDLMWSNINKGGILHVSPGRAHLWPGDPPRAPNAPDPGTSHPENPSCVDALGTMATALCFLSIFLQWERTLVRWSLGGWPWPLLTQHLWAAFSPGPWPGAEGH